MAGYPFKNGRGFQFLACLCVVFILKFISTKKNKEEKRSSKSAHCTITLVHKYIIDMKNGNYDFQCSI